MELALKIIIEVVSAIIAGCIVGVALYNFSKLDSKERIEAVEGWLLQAVILAEREFGGGTGKLKLSYVYDMFCTHFPWAAKAISYARFSELVDCALEEMRALLSSNNAIASIVENKEEG